MPFLMDKILTKYADQAFETARLRRNGVQTARELVSAKMLAELEAAGEMRKQHKPAAIGVQSINIYPRFSKPSQRGRRKVRQSIGPIGLCTCEGTIGKGAGTEPFAAVIFCTADPD